MAPLLWIGLVGGSLGAGAALAVLLVTPRRREGLIMVAGIASMAASALAGTRLTWVYESPTLPVIASLIAMGALGGGFALVSSLLPYAKPPVREIAMPAPGEPSRTLVVMLADTEAEEYLPGEVTREIEELVDAGLGEPGIAVTPFHYAAQKARYRAVGGRSPEERAVRDLAERLEARLDAGVYAGVTVVRCTEENALASTLRAAMNAGFSRTVVVGAYLAEGRCARRELEEAEARQWDAQGMSVIRTRSLWSSDDLARHVARRALAVRSEEGKTGVALVVHGQLAQTEHLNDSFDIQENAFANRVRMYLAEEGLDDEYIRVCAAEWSEPGVAETVRHLAALGNERVLVVPACHPFPNLQTLLDIPAAVRDARVPDSVRVVQIPSWGDEDVFADVLASAVDEALRES